MLGIAHFRAMQEIIISYDRASNLSNAFVASLLMEIQHRQN